MPDFEPANIDDELLSAYLDDELAPEERARVEERLAADPRARQLLDELRSVSRAMQGLPAATLGTDLRESVLRRAERAMLVPGESEPSRGLSDVARNVPIGRSKRAWAWAGAALAAGLLLMVFQSAPHRQKDLPVAVAKRERLSELEIHAVDQPRDDTADRAKSAPTIAAAPPAVAPGLGGRAAESAVAEVDETESSHIAGDDLVVVYVNATPEALRDNRINAVFARNQIEVEEPAASKSDADKPHDVDLVWVEAAPAQIMSSLAEMNQDRTNYVSIAVEDDLAPTQQARAAEQPAADLKQYNRGAAPSQQKLQVAPNNVLYYPTTRGQIEIDRGYLADQGASSRMLAKEKKQFAVEGQAQRVAPPVAMAGRAAEERPLESFGASSTATLPSAPGASVDANGSVKLGTARRAMQKLAAKAEMLQVLFVLTAADESASSPAPAKSPE